MLKQIKVSVIIFLIILFIAIFLFRNPLCRALIENNIFKHTGLKISIAEVKLDFLHNILDMRGVNLFNPPGFKNEILAKAEDVRIKYDLLDCLFKKPHLYLLTANLSEINIIKDRAGESNLSYFKEKESTSTGLSIVEKEPEIKNKRGILIDRIELSKVKVTYMDYQTESGQPDVIVSTVKGPWIFQNADRLNYLFSSLMAGGGRDNGAY